VLFIWYIPQNLLQIPEMILRMTPGPGEFITSVEKSRNKSERAPIHGKVEYSHYPYVNM